MVCVKYFIKTGLLYIISDHSVLLFNCKVYIAPGLRPGALAVLQDSWIVPMMLCMTVLL